MALSTDPHFLELFAELVADDSRSSRSNLRLVERLSDRLQRPGVRLQRELSPDGTKANLRAEIGPPTASSTDSARASGATGLVLCGHLDVVPADEPDWQSPPFVLTDTGPNWRGRGSADMKGFVALAVRLFETLDSSSFSAPLNLLFTYDEEVGSLGAQQAVSGSLLDGLPRRVLIGEPTELGVVHTHKGHLRLRVDTHGKPAHSGFPDRGVNAVEPLGPILVALTELKDELRQERARSSNRFPEVPFTVLNLAAVRAGTAVNVVPEAGRIDLGVRILPGTEIDPLIERIRQRVATAAPTASLKVERLSPPAFLASSEPFCAELCQLAGQSEPSSAAFSSDAGWLCEAGYHCLLFGPGSISVAHRADEFLPKAEVDRAADILEELIHRCCVSADDNGVGTGKKTDKPGKETNKTQEAKKTQEAQKGVQP